MNKRHRCTLKFVWTATLLSLTTLALDIPLSGAVQWSPETRLTTHSKQDMTPSLMQVWDGTIWVVWVSNRMGFGNDELFYKTSSNYGSSWTPDTRLTEAPGYDQSPSIVQAGNGTIWVVWSSYRTGNYELFYKTFNGSSWTSDAQLTVESNTDISPSIMQAADGLIWVAWHSSRTGNSELFYKTYNGTAWSTETQLTDNPSSDQYPSIVQANNGTIWVVWSSYRTGNYELFYKTFNGATWSYDSQLTDDPISYHLDASIARARDGTIWVSWQFGELQDELYYKIYNGTAWSSEVQLTSDPANDIASSIAQINDRKMWVVWQADRDKDFDLYYTTSNEIIIHDVATKNVAPSATKVNQAEILPISVTVENQGDMNETFNVDLFANETLIESTTVTLANGTTTQLTLSWNTASVEKGRYSMRAEASSVPYEIETADNVCRDGIVTVTMQGDVNGDLTVDINDLIILTEAYGLTSASPSWNPNADINKDSKINVLDLLLLGENYR